MHRLKDGAISEGVQHVPAGPQSPRRSYFADDRFIIVPRMSTNKTSQFRFRNRSAHGKRAGVLLPPDDDTEFPRICFHPPRLT